MILSDKLKVGTYVRIIDGRTEWNGMFGMVSDIVDNVARIKCVTNPISTYLVGYWNKSDVEVVFSES